MIIEKLYKSVYLRTVYRLRLDRTFLDLRRPPWIVVGLNNHSNIPLNNDGLSDNFTSAEYFLTGSTLCVKMLAFTVVEDILY